MKNEIKIRTVREEDAAGLLDIYRPYVEKTAISFEYDVPSLEEFRSRITNIMKKHPYLVAELDGEVAGYAYTHDFVGRTAYDHSAELTIYLKENVRKMGIGKKLYQALEEISKAQNITNLYACIGYPEKEDEYLTRNSAEFHQHLGYQIVGKFYNCGCKFGRWYHMVWAEKIIGTHGPVPAPVIPFPELDVEILHKMGIETSRKITPSLW